MEPLRVLAHNVLARFIRKGLFKPKAGEADFPPPPAAREAGADDKPSRGLGCEVSLQLPELPCQRTCAR